MPRAEEVVAAIQAKDLHAVEKMLREDPTLAHARAGDGSSMLLLAAYHGARDVADLLLARGARPDVWEAAALGRLDDARSLLDARPELLAAHSHDGWTPLHLAAHFGHRDVADLLLARGADVHARSTNRLTNTPLQTAVAGRQAGTAALLLAHGAEADATYLGMTPLWVAAHNGDEANVRLLLDAGASPQVVDRQGRSVVAIAREKGLETVVRLLEAAAPPA